MRPLIRLLRPAVETRRWMIASALMAVAGVVLAGILLAASGWLITASALAGAGLLAVLDIFAPGAVIRAAAVGRTGARYLERLVGHEATFRQLAEIRISAFERLLAVSIDRLEALGRGDTMSRLTGDVDTLDHLFPRLVLPSAGAFGASMLALAAFWLLAPPAAVAMGLSLMGGGTLVVLIGVRAARGPGRDLAAATPATRSALTEWLFGLRELVSLDQAGVKSRSIVRRMDEALRAQLAQRRVEAAMQAGIALFGYLGFWLVLMVSVYLHAGGALSAPVAAGMALVVLALVDAWVPLAASWSFFETCRRAAGRIDAIADGPAMANEPSESARVEVLSDPGMSARRVWFRHRGAVDPVLAGIDLDLDPGEHVLLQGASGSGKTTLGKLLGGILHPDAGEITLGGYNLDRLSPALLRRMVGYLSQDPVLFTDTLAANLRLGAPDADDRALRGVLDAVALSEFVDGLPDGLESWIGEHGRSVSGGEGRRIALARLLLADFRVLILDEPLAGVDSTTAGRIAAGLAPWVAGRSVVVLSHDRRVLTRYDAVYRLDRGRVVQP